MATKSKRKPHFSPPMPPHLGCRREWCSEEGGSTGRSTAQIPNGVICLVSALAYHGLTTTMPKEIWVAIPRNAYAPVMGQPCRFIRMGDGIHQAGVETVKLGRQGNLRIYGQAVSVCQALRYRERIGLDLALEAFRTYLRQGGSVRALEEWADICRIRKTLATYLEAILQ